MVSCPYVHEPDATDAELERFFRDDHVHMALLVHEGRLVRVVERDGSAPLSERTVSAELPLVHAQALLRGLGRRRMAVVDDAGNLLGLLCLKASGEGFCSDADAANRQRDRRTSAPPA